MRIKYVNETFPEGVEVFLPSGAVVMALPGEEVELPDNIAQSLLEQADNWQPAEPAKPKAKKEDD